MSLILHKYINLMYGLFTDKQKQSLRVKFSNKLMIEHQFHDNILSESDFQNKINNVYSERNFNKMQYCLDRNILTISNVGYASILWFHIFCDYASEQCLIGQLDTIVITH